MMERENIIKALKCCSGIDCRGCPYFGHIPCTTPMKNDALALIKELTEDNERLRAIPEQLHKEMSERMLEERKIERKLAVREFAERLKAEAYTNNYCQEVVLVSNIDHIAKEILEE